VVLEFDSAYILDLGAADTILDDKRLSTSPIRETQALHARVQMEIGDAVPTGDFVDEVLSIQSAKRRQPDLEVV